MQTDPKVLTLVVDPAGAPLAADAVDLARDALAQCGGEPGPARWLARDIACDISFAAEDVPAAQAAVKAALGPRPVDAVAQVGAQRRKAILVADMESTMIENEMVDELAELVGARDRVSAITARAMNGELDFADSLRERVALLKGLPEGVLEDMRARIAYSPGARELVATMRAAGAHTLLISGGFQCFADPVGAALGFDGVVANALEIKAGALTGRVVEPILDRDSKLRALEAAARDRDLGPDAALAVGDGANDLPMLLAAGTGIAWRAKPAVAAAAPVRIDHGDLTALLYLQGYDQGEFVS